VILKQEDFIIAINTDGGWQIKRGVTAEIFQEAQTLK
jgi:hypothetical protein